MVNYRNNSFFVILQWKESLSMAIVVTFRRTKRMSMSIVKNGDVHVSAPIGTSKSLIEKFIDDNREWIEKARERKNKREKQRYEFFNQLSLDTHEKCDEALAKLQALILPMVEKYAKLMNVKPNQVYYRATISKWGSCDVKTRNICFSAYLLLLPKWCVEHVVVHELAHLIVPNHGKDFYAVMDRFFPRWKEAKVETKRIAGDLKNEE